MNSKNMNHYFAGAFFIQFVVLGICMSLHQWFIHMGGLIGVVEPVGDEVSNPTLGRLIFMVLSALGFVIISFIASKKAKGGKVLSPFILGCFGGTFLWQCIGEDLWHFSVSGEHFVPLEGISVLAIAILFAMLLLYGYKNQSFDWGIWCVLLSFAVNWFGHYVLIGIYPVFAGICSDMQWRRMIGLVLGIILSALGVFLGLKKANTLKQKILAAILCYYAVAVLAFGLMES